jgi:hypothetical protein
VSLPQAECLWQREKGYCFVLAHLPYTTPAEVLAIARRGAILFEIAHLGETETTLVAMNTIAVSGMMISSLMRTCLSVICFLLRLRHKINDFLQESHSYSP